MVIFMRLLFLSIFVYVNTMYYSLVLLAIVVSLLYVLVSNLMLHTLTMIMLSIVYIGAMIVLIGYICAVCPNMILSPFYFNGALFSFAAVLPYLIWPSEYMSVFNSSFVPMVNYFYTYSGLVVFRVVVLMLFITLLIVTSQYLTPKGPFRSVVL